MVSPGRGRGHHELPAVVRLDQPIQISSRTRPRGGPAIYPLSAPRLGRWSRVTIFVHGFNNNEKQARVRWRQTRVRLAPMLGVSKYMTRLAEYYWPGDRGIGPRFLKSVLYARDVQMARRCGQDLGRFLDERGSPQHVAFVGHSLGCRVVLEALRELRVRSSSVTCSTALLMAAAVPEGLCGFPNQFARAPGLASLAKREHVLYSFNDHVLRLWFPPGQWGAQLLRDDDPAPGSRSAVGRTGGPVGRWSLATQTRLDHSDYWVSNASLPYVAKTLGYPKTRRFVRHVVPRHRLPSARRR